MKHKNTNIEEDETILISVFYTSNYSLFQIAKSLLKNYGIKFWSDNVYMGFKLTGAIYNCEIKVLQKDEKAAKKILGELTSNQYIPSNKFDKKIQFFVGKWAVVIILTTIIIMITIFLILK